MLAIHLVLTDVPCRLVLVDNRTDCSLIYSDAGEVPAQWVQRMKSHGDWVQAVCFLRPTLCTFPVPEHSLGAGVLWG